MNREDSYKIINTIDYENFQIVLLYLSVGYD